ncbi:MAG TPA: hypothetical protein VLT35_01550 [Methanocella sp.]|nr:hypothetical protein [Methanocella sp.]
MAIVSVLLLGSAGVALATDSTSCSTCGTTGTTPISSITGIPTTISGVPTADQLTAAANSEINAFGFPDLSGLDNTLTVPLDTVDAATLDSPLCGVCGTIPDSTCNSQLTTFNGPEVNLGCPLVNVVSTPVNLVSPSLALSFPAINIAPQATVAIPQVNTCLNDFDINCLPVTNINACPTVCPTATPCSCK